MSKLCIVWGVSVEALNVEIAFLNHYTHCETSEVFILLKIMRNSMQVKSVGCWFVWGRGFFVYYFSLFHLSYVKMNIQISIYVIEFKAIVLVLVHFCARVQMNGCV